jgi:hypothetical protein
VTQLFLFGHFLSCNFERGFLHVPICRQKVFLIGSKSCAASYANSVALVHGKETFVDGFTCPNKDALDPFASDYVYNARLVCHVPKGVENNG